MDWKRSDALRRPTVQVALRFGVLFAILMSTQTPSIADQTLVRIADQSVSLEEPTLNGTQSEFEQLESLESILSGLSVRQFCRDSVVAPVRINLRYVKDANANRIGHLVHVAFVAHTSIQLFRDEDFADQLLGDPKDGTSIRLGSEELQNAGIRKVSEQTSFQRVEFVLLDQIKLRGVLRVETSSVNSLQRIDISLDNRFENVWSKQDSPGHRFPYQGFSGWITVTELAESIAESDAVLIEARLAFHEPTDWFAGSNFLRSKLPLALQESARKLRRRLKSN